MVIVEVVVNQPLEHARFTYAGVTYDYYFKKRVEIRLRTIYDWIIAQILNLRKIVVLKILSLFHGNTVLH